MTLVAVQYQYCCWILWEFIKSNTEEWKLQADDSSSASYCHKLYISYYAQQNLYLTNQFLFIYYFFFGEFFFFILTITENNMFRSSRAQFEYFHLFLSDMFPVIRKRKFRIAYWQNFSLYRGTSGIYRLRHYDTSSVGFWRSRPGLGISCLSGRFTAWG